jgi:hemerythrin-like domain-containing protein
MSQSDDLISVLAEEHRDLRQLLTELGLLAEFESLRHSLVVLMIAETVRHTVAEEAYLYPVIRAYLPEGQRIVEREIAGHEEMEQTLKMMESRDLTSAEFSRLLSRLNGVVRPHSRGEEKDLFPLLAKHVSKEELAVLGQKAAEAKKKASIPQRLAEPDSPLLDRILTSGTSLVERVRTYLRGHAYPL